MNATAAHATVESVGIELRGETVSVTGCQSATADRLMRLLIAMPELREVLGQTGRTR